MIKLIRFVSEIQAPEEDCRTYRPKRCGNNNKDEDNSPKARNDKNHQNSSQKFRQKSSFSLINAIVFFSVFFFCPVLILYVNTGLCVYLSRFVQLNRMLFFIPEMVLDPCLNEKKKKKKKRKKCLPECQSLSSSDIF